MRCFLYTFASPAVTSAFSPQVPQMFTPPWTFSVLCHRRLKHALFKECAVSRTLLLLQLWHQHFLHRSPKCLLPLAPSLFFAREEWLKHALSKECAVFCTLLFTQMWHQHFLHRSPKCNIGSKRYKQSQAAYTSNCLVTEIWAVMFTIGYTIPLPSPPPSPTHSFPYSGWQSHFESSLWNKTTDHLNVF